MKLLTGEDIWVAPQAVVTVDIIAESMVREDNFSKQSVIQFRLNDEGRNQCAAATPLHVGKGFAFIVNDMVVAAPVFSRQFLTALRKLLGTSPSTGEHPSGVNISAPRRSPSDRGVVRSTN